MRNFEIGDLVICIESGVIGRVLRFYVPTACEEQTMVLTRDGRQYHAPTRFWEKYWYLDDRLEEEDDKSNKKYKKK